jgi:uncharacterized protein (TIGR03382 family)
LREEIAAAFGALTALAVASRRRHVPVDEPLGVL